MLRANRPVFENGMEVDRMSFYNEGIMAEYDAPLQMARPFTAEDPPLYRPKSSMVRHRGSDTPDIWFPWERVGNEPVSDVGEFDLDVTSLIDHFDVLTQRDRLTGAQHFCACDNPSCSFRSYLFSGSQSFQGKRAARNDLDPRLRSRRVSLLSASTLSLHADYGIDRIGRSVSSTSLSASSQSGLAPDCITGSHPRDLSPHRSPVFPKRGNTSLRPIPDLPRNSPPELSEVHRELIQSAGGLNRVTRLYNNVVNLLNCNPDLLVPNNREGNTLLMILCCQPLSKYGDNTRDYLHIMVVIIVLCSFEAAEEVSSFASDRPLHGANILFARNDQDVSALELAALENKSTVVKYLALLYAPFSRDVNETNRRGHTVLHLLARKGDYAADALETLLKLEANKKKLIRIDVVNTGAKTPLDVAVACDDDANKRTSYTQVIRLFHNTIVEQVEELNRVYGNVL